MPFETIDEIKKAVQDQEAIQDLLRKRFEADFKLFALTKRVGVKRGYENYASSSPRNVFDKILDRLNRAQVTIQIKLPEDATEAQRREVSINELYLFGALSDVDRNLRKINEPPLREGLGWFIGARGWSSMRCLVYVPKGETNTVFDVMPLDPASVTYEFGPHGLIWAAHSRLLTIAQIDSEFGMTVAADDTLVIDFWTTEVNSVVVGDQWFKEKEPHPIGHVPIYVGTVGSMPTIARNYQQGSTTANATLAHRGDSVWASSRDLYSFRNKFVGWVMDAAKRGVVGSLIHYSEDGKAEIKGDPYAVYQEIKAKNSEKIEPLPIPGMPPETGAALQIINQDIEQSTLPSPESFGSVDGAIPSGRALSIMDDNTRSKYNPFSGAMANAITWLCEELLQQFAEQKAVGGKRRLQKPTVMRGYNAKEEYFSVNVKPNEIDPGSFVEVRVEPRLPRDKEGELNQFRLAVGPSGPSGEPAMSIQTGREEVLHLRDPDAEDDKVLAEKGKALPPILAANVAAALKRRGEPKLAEQVLVLAQQGPGSGAPPPPPLPPELIEAIVQMLVQTGQQELAAAFVDALGGPPEADAGAPVAEELGPGPGPPADAGSPASGTLIDSVPGQGPPY